VKEKGALPSYSTDRTEIHHKSLKSAYRRSNKGPDAIRTILREQARLAAFQNMTDTFDFEDDSGGTGDSTDGDDMNTDDDDVNTDDDDMNTDDDDMNTDDDEPNTDDDDADTDEDDMNSDEEDDVNLKKAKQFKIQKSTQSSVT
jgi:hypothetical protein